MSEESVPATPALYPHCGSFTSLLIRAECFHTYKDKGEEEWKLYKEKTSLDHARWYILQCPNCSKPTMMQAKEISRRPSVFSAWVRSVSNVEILYPSNKPILSHLPKDIEKMYAEAIKVKNLSPSSFAVQARRILEAVCQHENSPGKTLEQRLKHLADSGKIPQTLADVALHLRKLGNLGAHLDINDDVTEEDVPNILDFVELLLEYLYVAPAKIQEVSNRLGKSQQKTSTPPTVEDLF